MSGIGNSNLSLAIVVGNVVQELERRVMRGTLLLAAVLFLAPASTWTVGAPLTVVPLARAHAHNDYWHARPLLDALDHGFTSVESDVWLMNDDLLVAHELREVRPERTLRALYLEPLRQRIRQYGGRVYSDYPHPVILLVDIKSDAEATYRALHEQLRGYEDMLSVEGRPGAVLVIVSGNRPRELMLGQPRRHIGYDGRLTDLGGPLPAAFMPLISDNWTRHFRWMGIGQMPDAERRKLREVVQTAHTRRQRVRFWSTPDTGSAVEAVWVELLGAGVDLINTDRLEALRQFLLRTDPAPSLPPLR